MVPTLKRRLAALLALVLLSGISAKLLTKMSAADEAKLRSGTRSRTRNPSQSTVEEGRRLRHVDAVPLEVKESNDPYMIDFVVAGFPKCGTTYIQNKILYPSERLFVPHKEIHFLANDKYDEFRNEFSNTTELVPGSDKPMLSGYKSPFELGHQKAMRNLVTLFPDVRMIISLRHPVLQFESLYNYKLRQNEKLVKPPEEYIGICREGCDENDSSSSLSSGGTFETIVTRKRSQPCLEEVSFCTGNTNYHQYLSRLGLTPMNTQEELDLLDHHGMSIHRFPSWQKTSIDNNPQSWIRSPGYRRGESSHDNGNGRLFLMEIGQFDNRVNQTMTDELVADLEDFLGLDKGDIPLFPHREGEKPKIIYEYPPGRENYKLNICLDRYKPLREALLENSRKASKWILEYLLDPSNREVVVVSNIETFTRMLEGWRIDPCLIDEEDSN